MKLKIHGENMGDGSDSVFRIYLSEGRFIHDDRRFCDSFRRNQLPIETPLINTFDNTFKNISFYIGGRTKIVGYHSKGLGKRS
jgi:hypothetical protein